MEPIHFMRKNLLIKLKAYLFLLFILQISRFFVKSLAIKFPEIFFGNEPLIYQILTCISFFVIAQALTKVSEGVFTETNLSERLSKGLSHFLQKLTRMIIYSIAALLSLEHFGVSVTPLLASLGVGSIAVALALQDTLGNIFSGFYLLIDQPFQVGHLIRVDSGLEGKVLHIGWRSTQILLGSGHLLILPNSKLSTSQLINMSMPTPESLVQVKCGIRLTEDLQKVEALLSHVAANIQNRFYISEESQFKPLIRFQEIVSSTIEVSVQVKARDEAMVGLMKHELIKEMIAVLNQNEIKLRLRN